jgi:hypothetical protein
MFGTLNVTNSTLADNSASGGGGGTGGGSGYGGAVFNLDGTVNLTFATLAFNTVQAGSGSASNGNADGGAVYNLAYGNNISTGGAVTASLTLTDSILSNSTITGTSTAVNDLVNNQDTGNHTNGSSSNAGNKATVTATTNNGSSTNIVQQLVSGTITTGSITKGDPLLDPNGLQNNTGLTQTIALQLGSPALGIGTTATDPGTMQTVTVDQRGILRASPPSAGAYQGPSIIPSSVALGLGTTTYGQASTTSTSYSVSGYALSNPLVITAPAGVQIKLSNQTTWSSALTLTPNTTPGAVPSTIIDVRIGPLAAAGNISGSIKEVSVGAPERDVSVSGTVNQAPISYTIQNDSQTYGSPANLAVDLPGSFTTGINNETLSIGNYFSSGDTATANVGHYDITGTASDGTGAHAGKLSNYQVTLTKGTLTVNQAPISYTIGSDSQTYGSPANLAADLPGSFATGINGETLSIGNYFSSGDTATAKVGHYDITGTVSDGTGMHAGKLANYQVTLTKGTLTVNPKVLTITALDQTQVPGAATPPFFVLYSGFVLGQGPSVLGGNLTFSTKASGPGTYTITATGLTSSNYAIQFVPGKLTVLSPNDVVALMLARKLGIDPTTLSYVHYSQATNNLLGLVSGAGLDQTTQAALASPLQAGVAAFNQGQPSAGAGQLGVFLKYVRAHRGTTISPTLADALTTYAQHILNAVG